MRTSSLHFILPLFLAACLFPLSSKAQDIDYAKRSIDSLCQENMHGRGYVNRGDKRAATFLANEFNRLKLNNFRDDYFQFFPMSINTFPGALELRINNRKLTPGKAYLVYPFSGSAEGTFQLQPLNTEILSNKSSWSKFKRTDLSKKVVLVDSKGASGKEMEELFEVMPYNPLNAKGVLMIHDGKLTHSMSQQVAAHPAIMVLRDSLPEKPKKVSITLETAFLEQHQSQNVIGYIKGYQQPDSFIVFTAHYDHLGRMGSETVFPGANDNASGTAMLLDFAKYYTENPPAYSVAFMAFSGEEVGLLGSKHYTENPLFPLEQIKFLINIDLMGNGSKGITTVNGKVFEEAYKTLVNINEEKGYLPEVKARGKAANSDHHFFTEEGVPAFFIYSRGEFNAYHDVFDVPEDLPLERYEALFQLIRDFSDVMQGAPLK